MIFVVLCIVCVCLFLYRNKYSRIKNVAVLPNSLPLLGHCLLLKNDIFSFVKEFGNHSAENDGITTVYLGVLPFYVIADPNKATVILNNCLEKHFIYNLINPLFGDTLVSATGQVWKRNRKILDQAFKPQVLERYMGVFNTQAATLLEMIDEKAAKGYVDLTDDITRNVLETTCQTTMGMHPKENQNFVNDRYVKAIHEVFEIVTLRLLRPWMFFDFIFYFCKARKDLDEALKVITEVSAKMVALRKSDYLERTRNNEALTFNNGKHISYLDIVIENSTTDNGSLFTDLQLRYLCDNVLLAAFDTTTYELLYTLVCIGSDQEVQRKIYQEINEVLGEEERVSKEHLRKLTYLEATIKEAIRLYPIGPLVARQATEKIQLDNITLPMASLVIHLWAINRHQKYWGPEADEFKPERWLDSKTLPEHPNAFGSFSFGRRNCIGKLYAMMHMKTTLVPILRKYRIFADHKKMEFDCYIMLKAKSGHLMKFELR